MSAIKRAAASAAAMSIAVFGLSACAMHGSEPMRSDAMSVSGERTVMVGGAAMYPSKTIVENAANSADHTTLVAAVEAAALVPTLSGPGPFTVFAPTNAAFDKLPPGTVDTLIQPANRAALTQILTYHVVPGRVTAADIAARRSPPSKAMRSPRCSRAAMSC
jgi:uncharacterized surface protein with fasciclin (FAS1) repeats